LSDNKGFYQAASYLGQHKNISRGILKKTSCMGQEEREEIAILEAVKKVWPLIESGEIDTMSIPDLIDKALMPFIENRGFALWQRDVVTDMAIRKGDTTLREQWKTHKELRDGENASQNENANVES